MTSDMIAEEIKIVSIDRDHARTALNDVLAMPNTTEIIRNAAYETLARLIRKLAALAVEFEAALDAEEAASSAPAMVTVSADDLAALVAVVNDRIQLAEIRERTGISWVVRDETDALKALVARVTVVAAEAA